jgi:hypothetical protein
MLSLLLLIACAGLPGDPCGPAERAVLAEFPLYDNTTVQPEHNPNHTGCVLAYSTTGTPEEALAYFVKELEARAWKGVPHFASGEHELSAYRDGMSYGIRIGGDNPFTQAMPSGNTVVSVAVTELPTGPIPHFEPNVDIAGIELSSEELEPFVGEYGSNGHVEAVVTLVDEQLHVRRPSRLANVLIPIGPTTFRVEDFSDIFLFEFEVVGSEVERIKIKQDFTHLHSVGGTMPLQVELERLN